MKLITFCFLSLRSEIKLKKSRGTLMLNAIPTLLLHYCLYFFLLVLFLYAFAECLAKVTGSTWKS